MCGASNSMPIRCSRRRQRRHHHRRRRRRLSNLSRKLNVFVAYHSLFRLLQSCVALRSLTLSLSLAPSIFLPLSASAPKCWSEIQIAPCICGRRVCHWHQASKNTIKFRSKIEFRRMRSRCTASLKLVKFMMQMISRNHYLFILISFFPQNKRAIVSVAQMQCKQINQKLWNEFYAEIKFPSNFDSSSPHVRHTGI